MFVKSTRFKQVCQLLLSLIVAKNLAQLSSAKKQNKNQNRFRHVRNILPLFSCVFFYGFWLANWIVCACMLWLAIVITSVLLCSFKLKASGDNNESCLRSPSYFDSNYIPVKPVYLELSKVLALFRKLSYQRRVVVGSRGSYTIDQFWPKCPRTLKLLLTLASHTNTWPSFDPVTNICPLQS